MSCANLNLFETDPDKFLLRFVTMDEFWVQHFILESKYVIYIQCNSLNNEITLAHPAKEDKVCFDSWEVYGLGFLDANGIVMVDYRLKDIPCDWKVKVKNKSVSIYIFLNIYNYCTHTFQMPDGVHGHV